MVEIIDITNKTDANTSIKNNNVGANIHNTKNNINANATTISATENKPYDIKSTVGNILGETAKVLSPLIFGQGAYNLTYNAVDKYTVEDTYVGDGIVYLSAIAAAALTANQVIQKSDVIYETANQFGKNACDRIEETGKNMLNNVLPEKLMFSLNNEDVNSENKNKPNQKNKI